jgi:hypothetical protein
MTISGVNVTVAVGLFAAIGDISRFAGSEKLVCISASIRSLSERLEKSVLLSAVLIIRLP